MVYICIAKEKRSLLPGASRKTCGNSSFDGVRSDGRSGSLRGKWFENAGIAQLVEHDLAKVGVASSSLVSRSL